MLFHLKVSFLPRATERRLFRPRPDHVAMSEEPIRAEDWKKINNTRGSFSAAGA